MSQTKFTLHLLANKPLYPEDRIARLKHWISGEDVGYQQTFLEFARLNNLPETMYIKPFDSEGGSGSTFKYRIPDNMWYSMCSDPRL